MNRRIRPISRYSTNKRVAVIGDIHGRIDHLTKLLMKLDDDIEIITAGDVCDRGPDTNLVIDLLIKKKARGVMGNHDEWLWRWAKFGEFHRSVMSMGAESTLTSYGSIGKSEFEVRKENKLVPKSHLEWLDSLPVVLDLSVQNKKYWVIHAGVSNTVDVSGINTDKIVPYLSEREQELLMWQHNFPETVHEVDRPVIMGHSIQEAKNYGHLITVDTGCGTLVNGCLSAVILPDHTFVSSE